MTDFWCQVMSTGLLTHWGWMTHICASKLTIIGSDNGLSPSRHQAIIWTNAGILLIRPSGTNFSEILIEIDVFSFKKMQLKMSSAKCRPFCLGLNVLSNKIQWNWNQNTIHQCTWYQYIWWYCLQKGRHFVQTPMVQIMASRLFSAEPLSKPMLVYCQLNP